MQTIEGLMLAISKSYSYLFTLFQSVQHLNNRINLNTVCSNVAWFYQSTEETCVNPSVFESSFTVCVMVDSSTASHAGFAVLGGLSTSSGASLDALTLPPVTPKPPARPLRGRQKSLKHLLKFSSKKA